MLLVLGLAAVIWGVGSALGARRQQRVVLVGVLFLLVLGLHLALPDGHALRMATGESPALWALLGGFACIGMIYGRRGVM